MKEYQFTYAYYSNLKLFIHSSFVGWVDVFVFTIFFGLHFFYFGQKFSNDKYISEFIEKQNWFENA